MRARRPPDRPRLVVATRRGQPAALTGRNERVANPTAKAATSVLGAGAVEVQSDTAVASVSVPEVSGVVVTSPRTAPAPHVGTLRLSIVVGPPCGFDSS